MKIKICFIMYPWEEIDPVDNATIRIIHEAVKRGHEVAITHPNNLAIRNSIIISLCKNIATDGKITNSITSFYKRVQFTSYMRPLSEFDVIFMRDDPPLNGLVLNFLDSISNDVFIINDIDGLRKANNKVYTATYFGSEKELTPATHVSKNIDYLLHIIKESKNDKMIMKPLDGHGGSGVIIIERAAMKNIRSLLDFYIHRDKNNSNYVILQEYIEGADQGDVRILILDGKPIGALKRIPAQHDGRSNLSAGGSIAKHKLTKEDKMLCQQVGEKLIQNGIYFAGIDIINGKLIEVNVVSPGGIAQINKLNEVKLQEKIITYLEQVIASKNDSKKA